MRCEKKNEISRPAPAYFSGFFLARGKTGSLETGKLADMVIWNKNYYSIPTDEIKDVKALLTFVGGKIVYEKKAG